VLVEFALVSLVLWMLFAVAIDFGRLMFSAQALQDAARVAARELALMPLPADFTFDELFDRSSLLDPMKAPYYQKVQDQIFNPACLVINIEDKTDDEVDAFLATMPVVNKALRPLMFVDLSGGRRLLRYPGALLSDTTGSQCGTEPPTGFVVGIPQVSRPSGVETVEWIPVIQEIQPGHFSLTSGTAPAGIVGIRLNFPYEAAAITSFQPNPPGPLEFEPNLNPNYADEGAVAEDNPAARPGDTLPDDSTDPNRFGPYKGPYGLGRQLAFASTVRPYSRVLAGQAIARREIFLPEVTP
jgi:hypothetical protein